MVEKKYLLNKIVESFIDDFLCMNGLADCYRYTAIQGILRYSYICGDIDNVVRDSYLKKLRDIVGGFFGDNVVDPFSYTL